MKAVSGCYKEQRDVTWTAQVNNRQPCIKNDAIRKKIPAWIENEYSSFFDMLQFQNIQHPLLTSVGNACTSYTYIHTFTHRAIKYLNKSLKE